MSADSNADVIATYGLFIVGGRVAYAVAALVCFEHLLTVKYDVDFLWRRKWSLATWIFVSNRCLLLGSVMFQIMPGVPQICNNTRVMNALAFLLNGEFTIIPTHLFSIVRAFALLRDHSWRLPATWILSVLTLTVVALSAFAQFSQTWIYVDAPIVGPSCFSHGPSVPLAIISRLDKVGSVVSIVAASIVLGIALLKTARQVHQSSRLGLKTTLSEVLLRDGILFFLLILLQDLYATIDPLNATFFNSATSYIVAPLFNVLPLMLLSRFIINLRQIDAPGGTDTSAPRHPSRVSVLRFRMPTLDGVVGNLGAPLDFEAEHRLGDDDDGARDGGADGGLELRGAGAARTSWAIGVADAGAVSPSGGGGADADADADVLDIDDGGLAELRRSAVPPV